MYILAPFLTISECSLLCVTKKKIKKLLSVIINEKTAKLKKGCGAAVITPITLNIINGKNVITSDRFISDQLSLKS